MTSKHSPAKVTLGMTKGKPLAISVPAFRYHASDDELEEFFPSTDEEEAFTSKSNKLSPKSSPSKSVGTKVDCNEVPEGGLERRSTSMDGNLSEGTPPSDPWKVLSEIKGKITKTFEEKLSEIKSDRRKGKSRSRDNSSISDSEGPGDVTPTEDNAFEKLEKDCSPVVRRRGRASSTSGASSRFAGFSRIKTGLKAKNSEEVSVESGIEAAELAEEDPSKTNSTTVVDERDRTIPKIVREEERARIPTVVKSMRLLAHNEESSGTIGSTFEQPFSYLKTQIVYRLFVLMIVLWCSYYVMPLPGYLRGLVAGICATVTIQNIINCIMKILTTPQEPPVDVMSSVPVLEIPAAEEHAVVERYEGWMNELPYRYDPDNYHVARTKPVFFRLESNVLRVMETRTRIPKRAIWDEPKHKAKFVRRRAYSLTGAKVELLPGGLIRRRRWSKKYPICITLQENVIIETITLKGSSDDEARQLETDNEKPTVEEEETDEDLSQSRDTKDVFEDCNEDMNEQCRLFVFARTDREKEVWFRRLLSAANLASTRDSVSSTKDPPISNQNQNLTSSSAQLDINIELSYSTYMGRYIDAQTTPMTDTATSLVNSDVNWMNALLGRILFDMHKCPDMINLIQDKIQRKLSNIKLPYFMESLLVSELVIGQGAPFIHRASKPTIDEKGLWLDLDISYEGCLTMKIETKLNLLKLTRAGSVSGNSTEILAVEKPKPARSPMFDSDVEDSPETSTEDEDSTHLTAANPSKESTPSQSSSRKFLSMVDKIAANKYFQHAAEISYVRKAMAGVSNTEIRLMVSVSSIEGCLALNIPPSPSDRLWYGFRNVPKISLTAKPAVGERAVNIGYVTHWIEKKLLREFQKIVVLPNMDDLVIPLCPNYPYDS
ncbi:testis-expressed protein 2 [Cephus cinctus]|uniref:Testis-expressed protein 2 n=1 Tax=Cephus cinctus TaxID=211228 RepID=A0AAJ7BKU9_CEPCN|nr:testis-expressed protein 2 [Cephus cinctus]